MMRLIRFALFLLLSVIPVATLSGAVTLSRVFSDHMVLQSGIPVPVWGTAEPGEEITVKLSGIERSVTAGPQGTWFVKFPPQQPCANPISFAVEGSSSLTVHDVLVGEVWICAGQSNMAFSLYNALDGQNEVASSYNPSIRLLNLFGAADGGPGTYDRNQIQRLEPDTFCNGRWAVCGAESANRFSAVGYYFSRMLHQKLDVPVGVICLAAGGTPTEAWIRRCALKSDPHLSPMLQGNWLNNEQLSAWCRQRAMQNLSRALKQGESIPSDELGPNHCFKPSFMWQSAVEPLIPYAIRGVIWYQGESNAESASQVVQHEMLFPLLVGDWRQQWGQGEFPLLFVQLPGMERPAWPLFRDSQRRFLDKLSNVGMAVTIDVGHPSDVHPTNKRPVGERLAHWALGSIYKKQSEAIYSGPLFQRLEVHDRVLVLCFEQVGRGLISNDQAPLRHFEIAGPDGQFHPAEAVIDGDTLRLSSKSVLEPRHARYAWMPFPKPPVNFFNCSGLPASPFSTEAFK